MSIGKIATDVFIYRYEKEVIRSVRVFFNLVYNYSCIITLKVISYDCLFSTIPVEQSLTYANILNYFIEESMISSDGMKRRKYWYSLLD